MTNDQHFLEEKKKAIENLGIYELRGVARALGVSSPTTKKRDFLIEAINNLLKEDNVEVVQNASKGRPFKKLESVDSILNFLGDRVPGQPDFASSSVKYEDLVVFSQEIPVVKFFSNDQKNKMGVLRIINKSAYFIDLLTNETVFLSQDVLRNNDLQNGDLIEGIANEINQNQYNLTEILKINGVSSDDYRCDLVPMRVKVVPSKIKDYGDISLLQGARNVFVFSSPLYMEKKSTGFLEKIDNAEENVVFLGLDLCFEDKMIIDSKKRILKFVTEYGKDNLVKNFEKILDAINYAERQKRLGCEITFVLYDIAKIIDALDQYFSKSVSAQDGQYCHESTIILQKIVSLANAYQNGCDSTLLILCHEVDTPEVFIKNNILKTSRIIK